MSTYDFNTPFADRPEWALGLDNGCWLVFRDTALQYEEGIIRLTFEQAVAIATQKPVWRYLFLAEDGEVTGSNDREMYDDCCGAEDGTTALDVMAGESSYSGDIPEQEENIWAEDEEDEDSDD